MEDLLSLILGIVFFPITLLGSWVIVRPQEEKLILIETAVYMYAVVYWRTISWNVHWMSNPCL